MTASDPHGPTWYAATMVAAERRPSLTYDLDVDVCVIGGGLAGLTAAREVARRGWSVAVLEATRIASQASGSNGGVVAPGFSETIEAIVRRVGLKRAKEMWALSAGGVEYIRGLIRETAMPGVEPVDGRLVVRTVDDEDDLLRQVAMMRVDLGADVEAWPTVQVSEALSSPLYFQAMHMPTAFHIQPLNYALGLAAAAERAGARIFEETPAVAIDAAGIRKRVDTPNGRVRAQHIVLAGGVHLGAVFPVLAETVVPVASYLATTAPLGAKLSEAIRYTGAVSDTRRASNSYRVVSGDRLMWGGRITTRLSTPRRLARLLQRDIRAIFPQLEAVEISHAWSGVTSYAVHNMPQIGELSRGVWIAGAFGLHGLNTSTMAGDLIARAIVEDDDRWRLFSDYELVWAGGRLGRAVAQGVFWSMPLRDAAASGLARFRQVLQQRAAERSRQKAAAKVRSAADEAARKIVAESARFAAEEPANRPAETQVRRAQEPAGQVAEEGRRHVPQDLERLAPPRLPIAVPATWQRPVDREPPPLPGAGRRVAEAAAQLEAEEVTERLASALREADESSRHEVDSASPPAALDAADSAIAQLIQAIGPADGGPDVVADGASASAASEAISPDAFDQAAGPVDRDPQRASPRADDR
jgi:glycine/D-amino acid oxidase-like deaminating enzyme